MSAVFAHANFQQYCWAVIEVRDFGQHMVSAALFQSQPFLAKAEGHNHR